MHLRQNPLDLTGWLVYADWLEEHGINARALYYRTWLEACIELWKASRANVSDNAQWEYVVGKYTLRVYKYSFVYGYLREIYNRSVLSHEMVNGNGLRMAVGGYINEIHPYDAHIHPSKTAPVRNNDNDWNPINYLKACNRICSRLESMEQSRLAKQKRYEKKANRHDPKETRIKTETIV